MTDQSGEVSCGSTSDPSSSARGDHHANTTSSPASLKCCTICGATKTPLWRGGPSGPKSLCNACGIRYRKERRESMGLSSGVEKKINKTNKGNKHINGSSSKIKIKNKDSKSGGGAGGGGGKMDVLRLLGFDAEVLLKERSMLWLKRRRRLGEEEEAAVLLMALSSGFL